jgi:radical SAM superfamily enzyme YgiQ (UPF0313 family)
LPLELLRLLKQAGLTSITVGVETPSDPTLKSYRRTTINKDRQHAFVASCRALGIRTVAGFMIGFPEDTEYSIRQVLRYAKSLGPTFANFNVVTPYPGTAFYETMRDRLDTIDYSRFNVYTPMLKYDHLTSIQVEELLGKCFQHYYFRWQYLKENAALLWPGLRRLGIGAEPRQEVLSMRATASSPTSRAELPLLGDAESQHSCDRGSVPHNADVAATQRTESPVHSTKY